jgi:predicted ATP-dependent serine protease
MKNLVMQKKRGRKPKVKETVAFDPKSVQIFKGSELTFGEAVFRPMSTGTLMDSILSTDKGLMPAVNMIICGGPGSGKSTVVLDMLSKLALEVKRYCL